MISLRSKFLTAAAVLSSLLVSSTGSAQWVQSNGPYGCDASCVAGFGRVLLSGRACTGKGCGLYRSTDQGISWTHSAFDGKGVISFHTNGTTAYAAVDQDGVYRSADSGSTWQLFRPRTSDVSALATNGNQFVVAGDGVFLSKDSGASWQSIGWTDPSIHEIRCVAWRDESIFAGLGAHTSFPCIYRTTNNGQSWSGVGRIGNYIVTSFAVIDTAIFASTLDSGIFRSTDNGDNWDFVNNGLMSVAVTSLLARGSALFAGTAGGGVFVSTDNGTNWQSLNGNLSDQFVVSLAANGTELISGTSGVGVYRSTDSGRSWIPTANNAAIVENLGSIVSDGVDLYAASGGSGVYRSTDNGFSWNPIDAGLPGLEVGPLAVMGPYLLAGVGDFEILRSSDKGQHWAPSSLPIDGFSFFAVGRSKIFAAQWDCCGVYSSSDSGQTWSRCFGDYNIIGIAGLVADGPNVFVTVAYSVPEIDSDGTYWSSDDGESWRRVDTGHMKYVNFGAIALKGSNAFAASNGFVFRSTDTGSTWNKIDSNVNLQSLMIHDGNIFSANQWGFYFSTDDGAHWKGDNTGLRDSDIQPILFYNSTVFVGTSHTGVWRRPLSEMIPTSGVAEQPKAPDIAAQAYPNPFSEKTTIRFTTAERGPVHLSVVNLLGVEIARLFDGELDAGEHAFEWDAKEEVAGTFFCLIREGAAVGAHHAVPIMLSR